MDRVGVPGGGGSGRPGRIGRLLAIAVALAAVAAVLALATALASAVSRRHAADPLASAQGVPARARSGSPATPGTGAPGAGADTKRVRAPGAREIVIDFDSGRLDLEAATGDVAEATVERRWTGRPPTLKESFEGGILRVVSRCPQPRRFHADRCRVHGRVSVPAGIRLRADVDAGDLTATAVHGDLDLGTSAGAVHVSRLAGPVRLRADAGSIAAEDLSSSSFEARSGTGNLRASFLRPPSTVEMTTNAGSIDLAVPLASYALDAGAGVGLSSIGIPNDHTAPRHLLVRAAVGQVRISAR